MRMGGMDLIRGGRYVLLLLTLHPEFIFFLVLQVWGSATPASKKKTSVSSATSAGDLLPHQNDPNYLGGLGEGWASSRPASGSWSDEVNEANFTHMVRLRSTFHRIV